METGVVPGGGTWYLGGYTWWSWKFVDPPTHTRNFHLKPTHVHAIFTFSIRTLAHFYDLTHSCTQILSGSTHFCTIFQAPQAKFLKIWPFSLKYARILPIFDKTDPLMYAVSKTRPTHVRTFWISKPTLIGSSWYPRIYWSTPPLPGVWRKMCIKVSWKKRYHDWDWVITISNVHEK